MHWALWTLIIILALLILIFLWIYIYFYLFLKKTEKTRQEILELLNNGLLQDFQENKSYDEVKEKYFKLIDLLDTFSQYVHFSSLMKEKKYDRKGDCLLVQYLEENGEKIARLHLRAFPIRTLHEKLKPKENFIDAFKLCEELFKEKTDLNCIELITHNKLINESIVKRIITRHNLALTYTVDHNYKIGYLPWIYAEWVLINGGENPKSPEAYTQLHKINRPVYIKITRA